MAETLKEYLVKLGWDINKSQLTQSLHSINSFSSSSEGLISRLSKNLLKAGSAVASALLGTTSAVTAMMFGVADADREVERFARRMWMTESQARSLTTALDAVGASYQDIYYMTAEEYRNYLETDFDDVDLKELKDIRKIRIDRNHTKEKRIAQYLRQVGNPYLVCIGNVKVKIRFANNGVSFEDAFEELLLSV